MGENRESGFSGLVCFKLNVFLKERKLKKRIRKKRQKRKDA